jgi:glycosyltransferase involved in cell wall biosynthesis
LTRERLCSLYQLCDCYVSPHRSEGFGLTIATAMYYGKPVIATGYSGNMDFTNEENAFLIDYSLMPVAEEAGEYRKNYAWAEPCTADLVRLLKEVVTNPEESRARAARGREFVRRNFSRAAVESAIRARLAPWLPPGC